VAGEGKAQPPDRQRLVAVVAGFSEEEMHSPLTAFRSKLHQLGWTEGRNLAIDARLGAGDYQRMTAEARMLVNRTPDVIVTMGTPDLTAVRQHTHSVASWRAATGLSAIHDFDRALTPALCGHVIGLWRAPRTRSDGRSGGFRCGLVGVNDFRTCGLLLLGRLTIIVIAVAGIIVVVAAVIIAVATVATVP